MIKVWKKKWREQLEHNDGHENLGGSGTSGAPSLAASEPAPPVDFQAAVPPVHSGTNLKRSQTQASLDTPPSKKIKTDVASSPESSSGANSSIVDPDNASCAPSEVVLMYDKVHEVVETELLRHIRSLDVSESIFPHHLNEARHVGMDVGACAADLVWRRALKNIDIDISPYSEEEDDDGPIEILNKTKAKIRDAVKNWAFTMPNLDPNSRGFNVTPKFLRLVQILRSCEPYGEDFRGIVFGRTRPSLRLFFHTT